ncbi:PRE C2HC and/or Herpes U47 domain containing protein [Asbolus verrucosus]|uniref:PRE C2HC and/or Herpes U47 domain containing protein n=1 Tax=Asbolus verrucosus TaxID=1661398 RepID=A0A482W9E3_ASBVE|nr:PRE C2HC and/or Herpes U47 domain containing protein [Asbolus verrucosus]
MDETTNQENQPTTEPENEKVKQTKREEFELPKKKAKKRTFTQLNIQPSQNNRFEALSTNTDTTEKIESNTVNEKETVEKQNSTPIYLRNKEKWASVNKLLEVKKINITKATNTKDGIRIQLQTEYDYRTMYNLFKQKDLEFHTHQLKTEKTLKVVAKGIPVEVDEKEIHDDLKSKGYPAVKITRMNKKGNVPADMVIIEIKREYKSIYNIENINGLIIKVEALRSNGQNVQCHRCQLYGHIQKNCNAEFK